MHQMEYARFAALAQPGYVVPLWWEVPADLETPVAIAGKLAAYDNLFLLESVEGGEQWGRYSFIGCGPGATFRSRDGYYELFQEQTLLQQGQAADPLAVLQDWLSGFQAPEVPELPRFWGGAVGYIGYDAVRYWEQLPTDKAAAIGLWDTYLYLPQRLLIFDNLRHRLKLVYTVHITPGSDMAALYEQGQEQLQALATVLRQPLAQDCPAGAGQLELEPNMSEAEFTAAVAQAKEYICAGDIIQVVLSQRFSGPAQAAPWCVYRALRGLNPSPYMYYLRLGDMEVVGASPEVLVRKEEQQVTLRPIAGTRPRGRTAEEDKALGEELLADPKERAEHVMLVDLGRNDLGRVCRTGSVQVEDLMVLEHYSHVIHIVSQVIGTLAEAATPLDVLRAAFPAGTLSGAPKIRAMEIIDELEPVRRELYGGAVGYLAYNGNMDMAIAIRTLVFFQGQVHLQAGAGIVADSQPQAEYQETWNKAQALRRALAWAQEGLN